MPSAVVKALIDPWRRRIKGAWRKVITRGMGGSDAHSRIELLYAMPDPWNLTAAREQYRFEQTLALLQARMGPVQAMLEIGCGEGHQSAYFSKFCQQLFGIDISHRAIARAGERLPKGRFAVAEIGQLPADFPSRFDVVTACEVLYFMSDVPAALARMNQLGDACVVTFFGPAARLMAPHLDAMPNVERGWFFHDPYPWLFAFWRNDAPAAGQLARA